MKSRQVWSVLASLLVAAALSPGPLAQAGGAVTGHVSVVLDDGVVRTVAFTAVSQKDGAASGHIDIEDPTPLAGQDVDGTGDPALADSPTGVRLRADVNCLAVDGDVAIVGGQVTKADVARYVGKQVLLFVEDSARSRGGFSWGFYEPTEYRFCGSYPWAAYSPEKIAGGSLQVER
jgi:hypothetical protein